MPEIIEIRKYADFLKKILKNKYIIDINILKGRYLKYGPFKLYDELKEKLPIKVLDIKTKGKFLYFVLENDYYIGTTLGLSGGWVYLPNSTKKFKFPILIDNIENLGNYDINLYKKIALNNRNIEFKLDKGLLYFYDSLSFGTIKIFNSKILINKKLDSIGPDIMNTEETTFQVFENQLLLKKNLEKYIGVVLMDQKVISGIGNYLRSDILWCSKISPFRKVKDLTKKELKEIYKYTIILTWGDYDFKYAVNKGIIKKSSKLPKDYKRIFFAYKQKEDIYKNAIVKELLYEGSQKRFIYWSVERQK